MADLWINVMGGLAIQAQEGRTVSIRSRKAEALLIYTLYSEKASCEREELATMFWEDMPEQDAFTNLRVTLASIKKALQDILIISRRQVSINPQVSFESDGLRILAVIDDYLGHDLSRTELSLESCKKVAQKLSLYKGDFLQGFFIRNSIAFDDWASFKREILRNQFINAAQIVIGNFYQYGQYSEGIALASQLQFIDRFNDAGYHWLIRLYAADGQREAASSAFERYRDFLRKELKTEPDPQIAELAAQVAKGEFSPETTQTDQAEKLKLPVRNNIPLHISSFVGRTHELDQLQSHLRNPQVRLVTLIGHGGAGKTRLAVQAARQNLSFFPDGVWFVPLEGVVSADLVLPEIYKQLKISYPKSSTAVSHLVDFLNGHRVLVVLDNFEHVLEASGIISEVIHQTLNSKFIVTSREMTGLPEETSIMIEGLHTHAKAGDAAQARPVRPLKAEPSAAAELFIERASRVVPDFKPQAAEMTVIEEVCELVGGLPLGIELAAIGIKNFSLQDLRDNIAADLSFLQSDQPDLPERQRSLESVFNAFWDQLSEEEHVLMARLSVFHGVVTQTAARKVAEVSAFFLGSLVSRGLLQRAMPRGYRAHSMHRRYVSQKLKENPQEYQSARQNHRDYYLSFVKAIEQQIRDNPQVSLLDEIEFEMDNIRAALAFTIEEQDEQTALEFCELLMPFWKIRAYYQEGYHWWRETFNLDTNANQVMKATALCAAAKLVSVLGDYAEAENFSNRGLEIAREIGDQHIIARAFNSLGAVATASGQAEKAQVYYAQSLDIYKSLRIEQAIAGTQVNIAALEIQNGNLPAARESLNRALVTFRNVGDSIGIINVLTHYAMIELLQDQQEDARRVLVEALEKSWALNARNELVVTYLLLSAYHLARGEWTRSMEMISLVDQQIQAWNISFPQHNQAMYENIHANLRQKLGEADYRQQREGGVELVEKEVVRRYIR